MLTVNAKHGAIGSDANNGSHAGSRIVEDGAHCEPTVLMSQESHSDEDRVHELDEHERNKAIIAVISCLAYSVSSLTMVVASKLVLTTYSFEYPMALLLFQNSVAVLGLLAAKILGLVDFEELSIARVKSWLPLNGLFVLMLLTGLNSLLYLTVPMVNIFKNSTNILIVIGDALLFDRVASAGTVVSLLILVIAAVLAGMNDLYFTVVGYSWMLLNCFCTALYVLYMKAVGNLTNLSNFGKVYYNNILSLPIIVVTDILFVGDLKSCLQSENMPIFESMESTLFFTSTGVAGFLISYASFWCIQHTSPTTFAMVGALTKIPSSIVGVFVFHTTLTSSGITFVSLSLLSGVMYAFFKARENAGHLESKNSACASSASTPVRAVVFTMFLFGGFVLVNMTQYEFRVVLPTVTEVSTGLTGGSN